MLHSCAYTTSPIQEFSQTYPDLSEAAHSSLRNTPDRGAGERKHIHAGLFANFQGLKFGLLVVEQYCVGVPMNDDVRR